LSMSQTENIDSDRSSYAPVMTKRRVISIRFYVSMKRLVDITGAILGLILLLPLFLVISLLVKLEDPRGPIIFHQMRIGKHGVPFRMYKFRSMVHNAEDLLDNLISSNEIEGHMFKMKDDPRITRVGKIIRKTSLDEFPQLWNVLIGEMSLVGPRPPLPREVKDYTAYDRRRLQVIPGCTGLWQVSGRNNLNFKQMVELDLKYIKDRSLWLDLKIILLTFKVMLFSKDGF
jgi:lipopolysaccharide/colanic/teichoic acid biosynthesis glycosyltransferase